jgi:hypothetical protein
LPKLNQAINAAANSKELQEKFAPIGFVVEPGTPEALAQRTQAGDGQVGQGDQGREDRAAVSGARVALPRA